MIPARLRSARHVRRRRASRTRRPLATRDRLLRKTSLTGPRSSRSADALRGPRRAQRGRDELFRRLVARRTDGRRERTARRWASRKCADVQNQNYSARARYKEAWKVAPNDAAKDRALIALAEVEIEDGDLKSAREHRRAISSAGYPEIAELDRRLGVERPVAVRGVADDARPGRRGRGYAPPKINGRDTWNARPMSMRGDPEPMGKITRVTLHHTADARAVGSSYAAVAERVKAYQTGHQQTNHWADIGYHFVDRPRRAGSGRAASSAGRARTPATSRRTRTTSASR